LWGGFVFQSEMGPIYFAGDTGPGEFFKKIHRRFGPMALSFLPIGGYEPKWFRKNIHLDPEEAVKAHIVLQSRLTESIHYETFRLSQEKFEEPVFALEKAREQLRVSPAAFRATEFGQIVNLADAGTTQHAQ